MRIASHGPSGNPEILHHPDVPDDERERHHGVGRHSPLGSQTVGKPARVQFEFRIGADTVATGGELLVVWRWPFDWGDLQTDDLHGAGYMKIEHSLVEERPVELSSRYNWIAGIEPWHHQIRVRVEQGELREGDCVRISCGVEGAGWPAPTCAAERAQFLMLIDHLGDGRRNRLVQQPSFRLTPDEAASCACIAPSDAVAGEPIEVLVRGDDVWGNPTQLPGEVALREADGGSVTIEPNSTRPDVARYSVTFPETGTYRLIAETTVGMATSNPIVVHTESPSESVWWGDLHSGQSEIGCGCGSLAENYAYGRDCAGLQFITHQANDHYVTVADWEETRRVTEECHEPGRYVTFLGCEWSALTKDGGDRNVFYHDDAPVLHRSDRFFREDIQDGWADAKTAEAFHDLMRDRNVLVNIHVGGRMTDLERYEPAIERLCELHSTHGTVEWFFRDALARGYRVGATAGTDGVMGRPGACYPGRRLIRNLRGGLTAVFAKNLSRDALWEALQNRRCYATTGARILLDFAVDGHSMGTEIFSNGPRTVTFRVIGTEPIERVDLFRGVEIIKTWPVAPVCNTADQRLLRILWGGTERRGTARLQRVAWDGSLTAQRGSLELIDTVNMLPPTDAVEQVGDRRIEWTSRTAGNDTGIVVRVDRDDAALTFSSGPANFEVSAAEALSQPQRIDAGGLDRRVQVSAPPSSDGPLTFETTAVDDSELAETTPYWLRVTQIDQSLAWSSPVFVAPRADG